MTSPFALVPKSRRPSVAVLVAAVVVAACGSSLQAPPGDGGAADGGALADGGARPACDTVASWDTTECKTALLEEAGLSGFAPCGQPSTMTPAEVTAACPMASSLSYFASPPPPPATPAPLRCDAGLEVTARADFFCKGTGAARRVAVYMRDRVSPPASTPNTLYDVFATQYIEAGNGGGTQSSARVVSSVQNQVGVVDFVTVREVPSPSVVSRVFSFSTRTFSTQNGMPVVSQPSPGWYGLARHVTPQ